MSPTHAARGRLTVDLDAPWRLYANRLPATGIALGTVTTARGETGALVYIERTGIYVRLNAGCMISLPQRKIQAAIDAARQAVGGRPHIAELCGARRASEPTPGYAGDNNGE